MSPSDDGYVHDPSRFDADGERVEDGTRFDEGDEGARDDEAAGDGHDDRIERPINPATADRSFDWRGWILVGVIVVAFVLAPLGIHRYPPGGEEYRFVLILFPLLPAVLLAATAVWATTRP